MMQQYTVIVERTGSNYSAYSPDVPGCIATGQTIGATLDEFRAALVFHLEGLSQDGTPWPEPQTTAHTVVV